jgi:hypothetical protein
VRASSSAIARTASAIAPDAGARWGCLCRRRRGSPRVPEATVGGPHRRASPPCGSSVRRSTGSSRRHRIERRRGRPLGRGSPHASADVRRRAPPSGRGPESRTPSEPAVGGGTRRRRSTHTDGVRQDPVASAPGACLPETSTVRAASHRPPRCAPEGGASEGAADHIAWSRTIPGPGEPQLPR